MTDVTGVRTPRIFRAPNFQLSLPQAPIKNAKSEILTVGKGLDNRSVGAILDAYQILPAFHHAMGNGVESFTTLVHDNNSTFDIGTVN